MLKKTSAEIKLITDIDMHLTIENGIRGGICEPTYYNAKANNEYVNPNFNNEKESYIISLDVNSLYASAMCYKIQYAEIKSDYNISKYTIEYMLNLDPYERYMFLLLIYITQKKFMIVILNFQFYAINLRLQMIRLKT